MVSFWPFRGSGDSAGTFEKTLSTLATRISTVSAKTDRLRQRARKIRVSWTLYGGFTYIFITLILIFVTGRENWGAQEYSLLAGGPLLLYGGRQLSDLYFNYRVSNHQDYLDSLYKERDATIEKLKQATKYNSTQQLLEKYGSPQPQQKGSLSNSGKKQTQQGPKDGKPDRVFVNPPPTANIQRGPPATVNKPAGPLPSSPQNPRINPPPTSPKGPPVTEEFAPNAFPAPLKRQSSTASYRESRWYDRILDALLGEDETQAKNRFALICQHCHLVNGQAPPGAQTLEDVGLWRCQGCKQMNGVQSPTEKLLEHVEKIDDHHSPIGTELSGAGSDSASADEKE